MYDVTNEDYLFWSAEAHEAHSFRMLCMKADLQYCRRQKERSQPIDYAVVDDFGMAETVFTAQYHRAHMFRELAKRGLSLADIAD